MLNVQSFLNHIILMGCICVSLPDRITGTPKDTLVALDLGGGSTQITFVPMEDDTVRGTPADYLTTISLLHKNLNLYTHR